jgi:hypothetical protein
VYRDECLFADTDGLSGKREGEEVKLTIITEHSSLEREGGGKLIVIKICQFFIKKIFLRKESFPRRVA